MLIHTKPAEGDEINSPLGCARNLLGSGVCFKARILLYYRGLSSMCIQLKPAQITRSRSQQFPTPILIHETVIEAFRGPSEKLVTPLDYT